MESHELAMAVSEIHLEARGRIYTSGHKSYASEDSQRFEVETFEDDFQGLEEELLDAINWAAMTILKLREAREKANRTLAQSGDTKEELSRARGLSGEDTRTARSALTRQRDLPSTHPDGPPSAISRHGHDS